MAHKLINRVCGIVERHVTRCRTRVAHNTALRYLDSLAEALDTAGRRSVRLYRPAGLPLSCPVLQVYAPGVKGIEIWIYVRAEPDGRWSFHEALHGRGTDSHLHPCTEVEEAAELISRLLKERIACRVPTD